MIITLSKFNAIVDDEESRNKLLFNTKKLNIYLGSSLLMTTTKVNM